MELLKKIRPNESWNTIQPRDTLVSVDVSG